MKAFELFIRKPVLTTLVSLCMVLLGIRAYRTLPLSNLPNVEFPYIVITAVYPGNSPVAMAANVARPIEEAAMSIEGLENVQSFNQQGVSQIVLQFRVGVAMSDIVQGVQTALSNAQVYLPPDLPAQPTFQKINPSMMPVYYIVLTSDQLSARDLYSLGAMPVQRRLSNINGVGTVVVFGARPAVRIQIDPAKLAARGLSLAQIEQQLALANPSIPSGKIEGSSHSFTIETKGQLSSAEEFAEVIVAHVNGAPLRIRDLGDALASVDLLNFSLSYRAEEKEAKSIIVLAVQKQSRANTVEVTRDVRRAIDEVQGNLPATVKLSILYDASASILTSIADVKESLVIAFVLVVLVIFLFLARVRETLVAAVALPLSMLGTFILMKLCGYSLDMLSMLGLTLAVGFVVDDAIVVLENAVRQIELGKPPFEAAIASLAEISPTILSMTLSLCAVFIPLVFMPGLIGQLLQEFGLTIVFAILASGVVSLVVSPMMCARLLKPKGGQPNALERAVSALFAATVDRYMKGLLWFLHHRWLAIVVSLGCFFGTFVVLGLVPKNFLPSGDTGSINGTLRLEPGVSPAKRKAVQAQAVSAVSAHPAVARTLAYSGTTRNAENEISLMLVLKPQKERAEIGRVAAELNRALAEIPGLQGGVTPMAMLSFGGDAGGGGEGGKRYSYQISGPDLDDVFKTAMHFVELLRAHPGFSDPRTDLSLDNPQLTVRINRERAKAMSVDPTSIEHTLYLAYSGNRVTLVKTSSEQYDVILELPPKYRDSAADLGQLYVPSQTGRLVPISALATWEIGTGPGKIQRDSMQNAVPISFSLREGFSLGEATAVIEQIKRDNVPAGVTADFTGEAKMFVELGGALIFLLLLAVFAMYVVLGILYEDYLNPLTVLSSLPLAGFGGVLTLLIFNVDFGLYAFVGLFLLLGIVKKNGIMMVDFAEAHRRKERCSPLVAVLEASRERFRPIIMTTLAAVMGAVPIALGWGASGKDYQALGLTIAGGLLFAQLVTLYVTPCIYTYVEDLRAWALRARSSGVRRTGAPGAPAPAAAVPVSTNE